MHTVAETLQRFSLFKELNPHQLAQIASAMKVENWDRGKPIILEGEPGDEMFILLEGEIEITKRMVLQNFGESDVKEKSLIRLKDSQSVFFGEMSLFENVERSASVTALTNVKLGVLTRKNVDQLCKDDPALGYLLFYRIGQKIAGDLRRANKDILKLTTAFVLALDCK